MFFKNFLPLSLGLASIAAATPLADLVPRQASCPAGEITQVIIETQVLAYPVFINQYFENNTIINVGGITITINNAPVTLITTVFPATTVTVTSTV